MKIRIKKSNGVWSIKPLESMLKYQWLDFCNLMTAEGGTYNHKLGAFVFAKKPNNFLEKYK